MTTDRAHFLDIIEDSYSAYYNISKEDLPAEYPLCFRANFHKRGEMYWLSKSIPIYGNEENEFAYIFSAESFDGDTVRRCIDFAMADGLRKVKPHKEHQCSNIKTVFIADRFEPEALQEIRSRKFQKSYHFSLWGYSSLLTCAVVPETEEVTVNRAGAEMKKYFHQLFSTQKKKV